MRLNEISFGEALPVDGYGPGFFRIGGEVIEGAVLCSAEGVAAWGGLDDAATLVTLAGKVDVLLLGMGPELAPLPAELRRTLDEAGIAPEPMGTPSAARTYNVLLSEGRRVAVAMLPV